MKQRQTETIFGNVSVNGNIYANNLDKLTKDVVELQKIASIPAITNLTYSQLKQLVKDDMLIPGNSYCITDYKPVLNTTDFPFLSTTKESDFNIIVTADTKNTLNENARAVAKLSQLITGVINKDNLIEHDLTDYIQLQGFIVNDTVTSAKDYFFHTGISQIEPLEKDMIIYDIGYLPHPDTKVMSPVLYRKTSPDQDVAPDNEYAYCFDCDYIEPYFYVETVTIDGIAYDKWRAYGVSEIDLNINTGHWQDLSEEVDNPFRSLILTNSIYNYFGQISAKLPTYTITKPVSDIKIIGFLIDDIIDTTYNDYKRDRIVDTCYRRAYNKNYWVPCLIKTDADYSDADPDYFEPYLYIETKLIDNHLYDIWAKYEGNNWLAADGISPISETKALIVTEHITEKVELDNTNYAKWALKYTLNNDNKAFPWINADKLTFKDNIKSVSDIKLFGNLIEDKINTSYNRNSKLAEFGYKKLPNTSDTAKYPVLYETSDNFLSGPNASLPDYGDIYYWEKKVSIDNEVYDQWHKWELWGDATDLDNGQWAIKFTAPAETKSTLITSSVVDIIYSNNTGIIYDLIDDHNNHFKFDAKNILMEQDQKYIPLLGKNCSDNNIEILPTSYINLKNNLDFSNNNINNTHIYSGIKNNLTNFPKVIEVPIQKNNPLIEVKPENSIELINPAQDINYYYNDSLASNAQIKPFNSFTGTTEELFNILGEGGTEHKWTDMSDMFEFCELLTNVPKLDTFNVTDMSGMFYACGALTTIPLLDTSKVINMSYMFSMEESERVNSNPGPALITIPLLDTANVTDMSEMFFQCSNLITIPQLDTSKVTNMSGMFDGCTSLTSIPLLDTSKVTSMYCMFHGCTSLTTIPVLNTSKVTDMSFMFDTCYNLTTIPLLSTDNVTDMSVMFDGCTSLTSIPVLNTSNVIDMSYMFSGCTSLKEIHMKNINADLDISETILEHDALVELISNLMPQPDPQTPSKTLTLGATLKAKLSPEEIKVATDKGWTIA